MIKITRRPFTLTILILMITLYTLPSVADINYADNAGFSITNVSESNAPVDVVYTQFIKHIDMWWPKDHTWWEGKLHIDEKAGGCFCETTDIASAVHMQISVIDPNKKVVMIGGLGPLQEMGINGALIWEFNVIESTINKDIDSDSHQSIPVQKGTKVTLTYNASGTIHFNGKKATNDEAVNLVTIVDSVQAQQLNALTMFSDTRFQH
jgi:hypothetical protein